MAKHILTARQFQVVFFLIVILTLGTGIAKAAEDGAATKGIRVTIGEETAFYETTESTVGDFLDSIGFELDAKDSLNYALGAETENSMRIVVTRAKNVKFLIDGNETKEIVVNSETIGKALAELRNETGLEYKFVDESTSSSDALIDNATIELYSIKEETYFALENISYENKTIENNEMFDDEHKVVQEGKMGVKRVEYLDTTIGDETVTKTVSEEVIEEPVDYIVEVGTRNRAEEEAKAKAEAEAKAKAEAEAKAKAAAAASAHNHSSYDFSNLSVQKEITMSATAYCPCSKCCGKWASGYTASGMKAGYGVVAVDRSVIPLGTKLYVEGYGYCIAADTGGAIKGNRIDLCFGTHYSALHAGYCRTPVKVSILG